jgi:hypothetical protein
MGSAATQKRTISRGKRPAKALRFLLCDMTGRVELSTPEGEWVANPIRCLDRAVDGNPAIILLRFGRMPRPESDALVELCVALKRNSHTKKTALLALLDAKHREMMEQLGRAGVDFVRFIGETPLNSIRILEIIDRLGPDDRLNRQLSVICPYLHYDPMDALRDLGLCGAYLDRLVLAGRRLREICETENHLRCEYYLNPRPR